MDGEEFGGAVRELGLVAGTVGHDEFVVSEVVVKPKGMADLMGRRLPGKPPRNHCAKGGPSIPFIHVGQSSRSSSPRGYRIHTLVDDEELDWTLSPQGFPDLLTETLVEVVLVSMFAVHSVDQRFTLFVGLKLKSQVPVAVPLHLFREKSLSTEDHRLHRIHDLGAKGAVIGQEVDHPHGARVLGVHRRPLGGLGVDDPAEDQILGFCRRSGSKGGRHVGEQ
ncbi:MAG: hypothetical protein OXG13_20410 [Gemmatimonadaceae bacterium]|nr:hypothetical protein [Gemmatimonadaceae bacterium]